MYQIKYKMSSLRTVKTFKRKGGEPDRSVTDNQSSSVILNELTMRARKSYSNCKLKQRGHTKTDINPNEVQII